MHNTKLDASIEGLKCKWCYYSL